MSATPSRSTSLSGVVVDDVDVELEVLVDVDVDVDVEVDVDVVVVSQPLHVLSHWLPKVAHNPSAKII